MANVTKRVADLQKQAQAILDELESVINTLPDNPNIQRIPGNVNAFVIRSSQLNDNLTPEYHDFKLTYRRVVEVLRGGRVEKIASNLQAIVDNGYYVYSNHRYRIHPDVIGQLRKLL